MVSDINNGDVVNLKIIRKKLKLSLPKLILIQKAQKKNPNLSDDEMNRKLLNLDEDANVEEYLKSKLTESEIETIKKFVPSL